MSEKIREIHESERTPVDTRQARVDRLRAIVLELFPGEEKRELRENIERSFLVPQVGDYHNEGMFMDSHLELILRHIEDVERGVFPDDIPFAIRDVLTRAVQNDPRAVRQYVFLHDIAKADCLTVKRGDEQQPVSWEEWIALLSPDDDGALALQGDEDALRRFLEKQGITGIAYWQETTEGSRHHGDIGAKALVATGIAADSPMLAAIEAHEVAYQFQRINAKTYEKYFEAMSPEARDFALLASYVDTMASLRPDGNPDLSNFLALAGSREKYELLPVLAEHLRNVALDKQKFSRACAAFSASAEPLTIDTLFDIEMKFQQECKMTTYDLEKLRNALEPLVESAAISTEECETILELAANDPQRLKPTFAAKMRLLASVLKQAEK